MHKLTSFIALWLLAFVQLSAQTEPKAGQWATWFIPSGKTYRLPAPPAGQSELKTVQTRQQQLDDAGRAAIQYWNSGAPGYRWKQLMDDNWMSDAHQNGILANMLLSVATYDAMVAAWDTKYAYNRPRPYASSAKVKALVPKPESPSYPCEHSVAAGVAVTIISHYFPALADSVNRMADAAMASRIAAGMAWPSDTKAGFELGKRIAAAEIEHTKGWLVNTPWDGKTPDQPNTWKGQFALLPSAGTSKTVALTSGSQFRPGPPPDFAKDMEELRNLKQTPRTMYNALRFDRGSVMSDLLDLKIFEHNLHLNPPRASRIYALSAIATYDCFVACWDAKYAYWGIRPEQYDPSFKPLLVAAPPFPGYPSGHAAVNGALGDLYGYLFPADQVLFRKMANDGAESRFQGGIHFRTDNEVALTLGRNVAGVVIEKAKADGANR